MLEKIIKIADHYGYEKQKMQLIEEMGELMQALNRLDKAKEQGDEIKIMNAKNNVAEELADVAIMAEQIVCLLDINNQAKNWKKQKIERQITRIEKELKDAELVPVVYGTHGIDIGTEHKVYCWRVPKNMEVPRVGEVVKVNTSQGPANAHIIRVGEMVQSEAKRHKAVIGKAEW